MMTTKRKRRWANGKLLHLICLWVLLLGLVGRSSVVEATDGVAVEDDAGTNENNACIAGDGRSCEANYDANVEDSNSDNVNAEESTSSEATSECTNVAAPICAQPPQDQDSKYRLYEYGGTAQAYKPNVPLSSITDTPAVCSDDIAAKHRYKPAHWPLHRSSQRKGTAPRLDVTLNLFSCSSNDQNCCCDATSPSLLRSIVEVWQTRPDGLYTSLQDAKHSVCRAKLPVQSRNGKAVVQFTTVAPGSTGAFSGLGPGGLDWSPYGVPVLHMLFAMQDHAPFVHDLPILMHATTLQRKDFRLSAFDWRGVSWTRPSPKATRVEVVGWQPESGTVRIEANVYLTVMESSTDEAVTREEALEREMCPSWVAGFPGSFHVEPLAVCFPSILGFFAI